MILVVDFGSQTTHLISRRLSELGVETYITLPEEAHKKAVVMRPAGVILSGGPASVYESGSPRLPESFFSLGIPLLGICYGWQLIAQALGGVVGPGKKEYGPATLMVTAAGELLSGVKNRSTVWMSHGDSVLSMPDGFVSLAHTATLPHAAVYHPRRRIFGVQFHPEVDHTEEGRTILLNFATRVCRATTTKQQKINIDHIVSDIQSTVGAGGVVCAVSGGVDSTVVAALVGRAIGKRLYPVYVESGLMREGTAADVVAIFQKHIGIKPVIVNAKKRFMNALRGVESSEKKRKIVGELYVRIFEEQLKKLRGVTHLAQGTIYSDLIESKGTKHAAHIKSHHNVGGLPKKMRLSLLEPLRPYYKDQVRAIGLLLGLPPDVVNRQVFPGPGQAIRILGAITPKRLKQQQMADAIVIEEMQRAGLYGSVYMSFSIMTNTFSTAVKGDGRSFMEVVAIRVVDSKDVMTTNWTRVPYDLLQTISSRIVNEVHGVSRVVFDITTKPPATMEWE